MPLARFASGESSGSPAATVSSLGATIVERWSATSWDVGSAPVSMPKAVSKARSKAGRSSRREMRVARAAQ